MPASVKPIGLLKEYLGGASEAPVPAGITVQEALERLGIPSPLVALVVVNEVPQAKDYRLQEGDCVRLLAIIGGGSS
jgi:sulfur carrier protein ThiS